MAGAAKDQRSRNAIFWVDRRGTEVRGIVVSLVPRCIQAPAHSQIQRQVVGDLQIILGKQREVILTSTEAAWS